MKKATLALCALLLSTAIWAEHHEHEKGLHAHEHGSIKLDIAVEGKTIEVGIDGPAESFLGFEHAPKTDKEKKTFESARDLWAKDLLTKIFILDKKLGCTSSEVKFEQEIEDHKDQKDEKGKKEAGIHSDIEASAKIICTQDLKGQSLTIALKKQYPHIKKLTIDVVASETKSINAKAEEVIKL